MKSIKSLLVLIILLSSITILANEKGTITGRVFDKETNEIVELANVFVVNQSNPQSVIGDVTNSEGKFEIKNIPFGNYDFHIQMVGYKKHLTKNIKIGKENLNLELNSIFIIKTAVKFSDVEVTAKRNQTEFKFDKKIYSIDKSMMSGNKTAADVLENIPSVSVDLDGNITLRGSGDVKILVDGKESGLLGVNSSVALRQFPSNLIKTIEVITNPSARYDAEGAAGIINIVLREDKKQGLNGSVDLTVGDNDNYGGGINLNYRQNDFNFFGDYGIQFKNRPGSGSIYQEFYNNSESAFLEGDRSSNRGGWFNFLRFGLNYYFNEKNILTGTFIYEYGREDNWSDITYKDYNSEKNLIKTVLRKSNEGELEKVFEYSLNYKKLFDKKDHVLTVSAKYQGINEHETSDVNEANFNTGLSDKQYVSNLEKADDILLQADYIFPFNEKGKFEAGYKSNFRKIVNDYYVEEIDENGTASKIPELTNNLDYKEYISSLYAMIANEKERITWQLGLRAEYSVIGTHLLLTDEKNDRDYLDLFPSLNFTYKISNENLLQINYTRRLKRPEHRQLNPFTGIEDSRNRRKGNPDLNPEYTHAFEMGHIKYWEKASLVSNIYYQYSTGVIQNFSYLEDGVTISQPQNLSNRSTYGLEFALSSDVTDWWKFDGSFNYYKAITDGANLGDEYKSNTTSWFSKVSAKVNPFESLEIQTRFNYFAAEKMVQGTRKAHYYIDLGISYDVFAGQGNLTLNIKDLLDSRKRENEVYTAEYYSLNEFRFSGRQITLGFNFRLNQDKKEKKDFDRD